MDTILNAPLWLLAIGVLVGVALLFNGLRGGRQNVLYAGYGVLAFVALLFVLRLLVPTDEKKVERQARGLMTAIGTGDWATVTAMTARASMYDWQGADLAKAARDSAEGYGLTAVDVNSLEVKREPLAMTVRVAITTHHKGQSTDNVPSTWDCQYQKRGKDWALIQITPVRIAFLNGADVEAILRRYVR